MTSMKPIVPRQKQRKTAMMGNNDQSEVKSQQPIIPMSKVSLDVIKKLQTEPYPQLTLATHSTISDALELYYNEYVRLFKQNQILNDELASILLERNNLADQFNQIKKMKSYDDNIRRRRRYASQIERNYHCPMPKCNKGYGSQGSLTHHVRLKHPKFFESGEYEIYLETYILPKQQLKNEDGKGLIDVELLEEVKIDCNEEVKVKVNKVESQQDRKVKQAKQENVPNPTATSKPYKNNKKLKQDQQLSSFTQQNPPSTPQMSRMMRQVDGYIVLEEEKGERSSLQNPANNAEVAITENGENKKQVIGEENVVKE